MFLFFVDSGTVQCVCGQPRPCTANTPNREAS